MSSRWVASSALLLALLAGAAVAFRPTPSLAAVVAFALLGLAWRYPLAGAVFTLVALAAVPYWLTASIGPVSLTAGGAVAFAVATVLVLRGDMPFRRAETCLMVFFGLCVFATVVAAVPPYGVRDQILLWISPYVIGRSLGSRLARPLLLTLLAVSAFAVIEYAAGFHPFVNIRGPQPVLNAWASLQVRGTHVRSEAAFGHALALGGVLVLAVPFAMRRRRPLLAVALLAAGTLATLSRAPMASAALAAVLATYCSGRGGVGRKGSRFVVMLLIISAVGFAYNSLREQAGTALTESTAYRSKAISATASTMNVIGLADNATLDPHTHALLFSGFNSIDNSPLQVGLTYGWMPLSILLLLALVLLKDVVVRRAGPATVALVASYVLFGSVALITQWVSFVWLVAGMAVAERVARPSPALPPAEQPAVKEVELQSHEAGSDLALV